MLAYNLDRTIFGPYSVGVVHGSRNAHKADQLLKAHSAEVIRDLGEGGPPLIITQDSEAKAVLQDVASYAATQELFALFKLLAMGRQDISNGRVEPLDGLKDRIRGHSGR